MSKQNEKWPLPADIQPDGYRCVILRIPDKPEYVTAFYDAYDMLCRWLSWEQRGDTSARDAGLLFRKYQPLWVDCEIPDAIDEDGNMAINVNVTTNCNCGDCGDTIVKLPTQVRPDGTTIYPVCLPVDPENPSGDYPAINPDPDTLTPPPGYVDWQSFIDSKCRAANYMVDALLQMSEAIDEAENRVSIVMHIVDTFIRFAPVSAQKTTSWNKFLKIVEAFLEFTENLEEVWDWVQTLSEVIENLRNQLVCIIYSTPDIVVAATAVGTTILDELALAAAWNQLTDQSKYSFTVLWNAVVHEIVPRAYDYEWVLSIPESYQPPYNCAACGGGDLGGGWRLIPLTYDSLLSVGGSGGVVGHNVTSLGSYIRLSSTADSPNDVGSFQTAWKADLAAGTWFYGVHVDMGNFVNAGAGGSVDIADPPTYPELDECTQLRNPPVPLWGITESDQGAVFELDTGITRNVGPACVSPGAQLLDGSEVFQYGFGTQSVLSGEMSADIKVFIIVRDEMLVV